MLWESSIDRHPKNTPDLTFNDQLSSTLEKIKNENKILVITGDFNYDLFKTETNPFAKKFIEIMYDNLLQPCILEPTRIVNGNKPALIDNIFINTLNKNAISGNLTSKISDHMPNFLLLSDTIEKTTPLKKNVRDFSKFKVEAFKADIAKIIGIDS